jgi:hypothetical protein
MSLFSILPYSGTLRCVLCILIDVSVECIIYITRVEIQPSKKPAAYWFLAWLIFYPEDGADAFLQNIGSHADFAALYSTSCIIHNYRCKNITSTFLCSNLKVPISRT